MRSSITFIFCFFVFLSYSQQQESVGIGNNDPRGLLDVENMQTADATAGLILPTTSDVTLLQDPQTGFNTSIEGTIAYDLTSDCVKYLKKMDGWSNCLLTVSSTN